MVRPILDDFALSADVIIRIIDERLLSKHIFGIQRLSSYTEYDDCGCVRVVKPVKLGETVITLSLSAKDPSKLYTDAWALHEFTALFLQSMMARMIAETDFPMMQTYVRAWMNSWSLSAFYCYLLSDGEYELMVSEDYTNGKLTVSQDLLNRSEATSILTMPPVEIVDGFRVMVVRTDYGDTSFVTVIAVDVAQVFIPCIADFYDRFLVIILSLCYLIMLREDREVTFKSFIHMMSASHAFSVVESRRESGAIVTEVGEIARNPQEHALIAEGFTDALAVKDVLRYRHAFRLLISHGVGFAQEHFRLLLPGPAVRWFTVSGSCEYDSVYEADVVCILYEDVSNMHQLESRVHETLSDMGLASRLLALHQYSVRSGRIYTTGQEILRELGYRATTEQIDLTALIVAEDIPVLLGLREGEAATIRLRGDHERWYKTVCTSHQEEPRGFLFSVQELTTLQTNIETTRDCFRVGSVSTSVAAWAIHLDDSSEPHLVFETKSYQYLEFLIDPDFLAEVPLAKLRALEAPITVELKMRLLEQQSYEWHSVTLIPCQPNEVLLVACNINEQRKTTDLLTQTQEMLDLAFTYSDVRLWSFEDTHRAELSILTINTDFADEIDMDWSTLEHNVTVESQEVIKKAFQEVLDGKPELEIEVPFFFDCVHWLLLRGFAVEDEGRRRLIGIHVDLTAIKEASAELQRQKAAAENAMMAKSTFLANMTHEIRAPLNGIYGLLEVLLGHDLTPEQREVVDTVQSSFTELNELLNDILDLAKLESGRLLPIFVNFDPVESIFSLDESFFNRHRKPSVLFHVLTEPDEPICYFGDPHCFLRIVIALLSNCVKFTPAGRIFIQIAHESDRALVLSVRDTGVGMDRAVLESIQRHFVRPDTAVIYEDSRVGVGLSMVTEMVRICGGTITIDSNLGAGTTVTVAFPWEPSLYPWFSRRQAPISAVLYSLDEHDWAVTLAFGKFYNLALEVVTDRADLLNRPQAAILLIDVQDAEMGNWLSRALARAPQHQIVACLSSLHFQGFSRTVEWFSRPLRLHLLRGYFARVASRRISAQTTFHVADEPIPKDLGLHILAVDDDATNRLVITKMLQKVGCTFRLAANGMDAIGAVREEYFDVVLLDQFMPGMDGPDAARGIRRLSGEAANVPIVAMTASNLQKDEKECREAGMDAFLSKPISLRTLARVLEGWRGRRSRLSNGGKERGFG